MGNRRHILYSFRGNLIQFFILSKNPSFQLGLGCVPHRFSVASCFYSNNNLSNDNNSYNDDAVVGSEGISFLNDYKNMFTMKEPPPSVVKFTQLLVDDNDVDVAQIKQYSCSLNHFKQMCAVGVPVNNHTAGTAIMSYCRLGQSKLGFTVLGCCFKQGIQPHVSIYNTLLKGFIREDKTHEAERLFSSSIQNQLWEPDVVTYNTMIQGLCKIGNNYTAIALLRLMDHHGISRSSVGVKYCKPDILTYNTIIHSLCHDTVIMIDDAFKLFNEMVLHKHLPPNVFTYNSLIYALSKLGRWDGVSRMLQQMQDAKISPQLRTFNIVVDTLCKQHLTDEAQLVINIMLETASKYSPDIVTYNSLIDGYCLRNEMTAAKALFDSFPSKSVKPNNATYHKLLDGYCKGLKMREAAHFFNSHCNQLDTVFDYIILRGLLEARRHNMLQVPPEEHLYMIHLKTFCDSDIESARALFHYMDDSNLNSNINVYNVLINGAIRWGKFDIARLLFRDIFLKGLQPDVETYRTMISGYCNGGLLKDAKQLFRKMEKGDCRPNNTIIANDLLQGYREKKPFDDAYKLYIEIGRRYIMSTSNLLWVYNQIIAREPNNWVKLLRDVLPEKDVFDVITDYEYDPYKGSK